MDQLGDGESGIPDVHVSVDDLRFYHQLVRAMSVEPTASSEDADASRCGKKVVLPPSSADAQLPCTAPPIQMQQIADAISSLSTNIADLVNSTTKIEQQMKDFERRPTTSTSKLYSDVTTVGPPPPARAPSSRIPPKKISAFPAADCASTAKTVADHPQTQKDPRERRWKKNRRRGIAGCGEPTDAAPFYAADRDIFIYRVSPDTTVEDIKRYLAKLKEKREMNITVKDLQCVSHPECVMKSFRLTVPCKEYPSLMRGDVWPPSVRVRRFVRPKSQANAA